MNILEQIVARKQQDLPKLKEKHILKERTRRQRSFEEILDGLQSKRIIAEIKRSSPSMGEIDMQLDFVQRARDYEAANTAMISVLTDEPYFCGSFDFLEKIGQNVDCPLLCKDFIIDEWQLDAAYSSGADAVLLIVTCLSEGRLQQLYHYALEKGLLPLVELYHASERYAAYQLRPSLLGVNSRNLKTMEIDLQQGAAILSLLRRELSMPQSRSIRANQGLAELPLFVGESGVSEKKEAQVWMQNGADCLLVGTSLMLVAQAKLDKKITELYLAFSSSTPKKIRE